MEATINFLDQFSTYSPLIPLLIASFQIIRGKTELLLFWIVFIPGLSIVSEAISIYFIREYSNNMPWFHTYVLLESILVFGFLYSISDYKKMTLVIGLVICMLIILYTLIFADIFAFNTTARIFQCFGITFICISYFYQVIEKEEEVFLYESAEFWVVVAILVYYCGSFFSFILYQRMIEDGSGAIWIYHNMANLFKHIILTLSLVLIKK